MVRHNHRPRRRRWDGRSYKARDTRLDRIVAIKVLSGLLSGAPELQQRFEREARTISQLNHPNICMLHDVGHHDGMPYIVLEYLDGDTLAHQLEKGALPVDDALAIAIGICEALDRAHRLGVIHRDLKPANVMLTKGSGTSTHPKLLDFGLAKLAAPAGLSPSAIDLTAPATVTTPLTTRGTIMGTFQYMAPEQLEGAEADVRTDVWGFTRVDRYSRHAATALAHRFRSGIARANTTFSAASSPARARARSSTGTLRHPRRFVAQLGNSRIDTPPGLALFGHVAILFRSAGRNAPS